MENATLYPTSHLGISVQGVLVEELAMANRGEDGKPLKARCERTGRLVTNLYRVGTKWVSQGVLLGWGLTQPQVDKLYNTGYNARTGGNKTASVRVTRAQLASDNIDTFINN